MSAHARILSQNEAQSRRLRTLASHFSGGAATASHVGGHYGGTSRDDGKGSASNASRALPSTRRLVTAAALAGGVLVAGEAVDAQQGGAGSLESLTVGELKALLSAANVDFRDCFEKQELVARLRSARESLDADTASRLQYLLQRQPTAASPLGANFALAEAAAAGEGLLPEEALTVALFKRCSPSVVHIRTSAVARTPFSVDALEIPQGAGTGIVWDENGHIVTNFHVIQSAQRAKVTLSDNTTWEASLVGYEADKDLAVLKISGPATLEPGAGNGLDVGGRIRAMPAPAPQKSYAGKQAPDKLVPIQVGTSQGLQVGQRVLALGNPFGLDRTLTQGIVSGVGRDIRSITGRTIRDVIQTDAAINPGNSGGPLLDARGKLIGVNTVIYSPSGASAGVGFAIPVDTVRRVVNAIIRTGRVVRPALGVHCAADAQRGQLGLRAGVLIIDVTPSGPAAKAGLQGTFRDRYGALVLGDVILDVDGAAVNSVEDLLAAVEEKHPGDAVKLRVARDGKERSVSAVLVERQSP
jgi:S1-C subfamily serine protease